MFGSYPMADPNDYVILSLVANRREDNTFINVG